jgi:hypothetical protein
MILRRLLSLGVGIRASSAELLEELSRLTAALPALPPETPLTVVYSVTVTASGFRICAPGTELQVAERGEVFRALEADLAARAAESRDYVMLHAAALERDGRILLVPGESGSGKSTVAAALLKRGFRYQSDEFAPLSADLTVWPYPLPLRLRETSLRVLPDLAPEVTIGPQAFRVDGEWVFHGLPAPSLVLSEGRRPVGAVLFPRRTTGIPTPIRPLKAGPAALELMACTINGHVLGERGFHVAVDLVAGVPSYELARGDLGRAAAIVDDLWERA